MDIYIHAILLNVTRNVGQPCVGYCHDKCADVSRKRTELWDSKLNMNGDVMCGSQGKDDK